MKKLCVGVNGAIGEIKSLVASFDCISSIYTSDYMKNTTGGRAGGVIRSVDQVREIARFLAERNVEYWVTNNHTVLVHRRDDGPFWDAYKEHILELQDAGVTGLIVGHPFVVDFVKRHSRLEVCVSTTAEVATARAARHFEDLGADMICPSYHINFDMEALSAVKASLRRARIKLLVNEFCLGDCIHRRYHQNSYVAETNLDKDYGYNCHKTVLSNPERILQNNTIRPEDLKHYLGITDLFKISLRAPPFNDAVTNHEVVKAYADEQYSGNYMNLISQHFSSMIQIPNDKLGALRGMKLKCSKACFSCDACKRIYDQAVIAA
jgi:collagenase-like PrtC family protease